MMVEEYKRNSKELQKIFEEKEKLDIKVEKLKEEELSLNKEYLFREKQVATYLECRKSVFGKIKYFFKAKNGKFTKAKNKSTAVKKIQEQNEIEKSIANAIIEPKELYTIEDLIKICIELDRINIRIKDASLDIKALKEKKITKDTPVIEATSGNMGIALAFVCATLGLKFIAVMPESMSIERRKLIKAYGAEIVLTPEFLNIVSL